MEPADTRPHTTHERQRAAGAFTVGIVATFAAAALVASANGHPTAPASAPGPTFGDRTSATIRPGHRPTFDKAHARKRAGHGPIREPTRSRDADSTFALGPFELRWPDWP